MVCRLRIEVLAVGNCYINVFQFEPVAKFALVQVVSIVVAVSIEVDHEFDPAVDVVAVEEEELDAQPVLVVDLFKIGDLLPGAELLHVLVVVLVLEVDHSIAPVVR